MDMNRRTMLTDMLPGAGVATIGWVIAPKAADAIPLGIIKTNAKSTNRRRERRSWL